MLNRGSMVWGFCVYFVYMIPLETDVLRKHRFQKLLIMSLATVVMLKRHVIMPTLTVILCNQWVVMPKRHVVLLIFTHAH